MVKRRYQGARTARKGAKRYDSGPRRRAAGYNGTVPDRDTLEPLQIGVISDTHGLLRPAATKALAGVDLIIHAGDVGAPEILPALQALAPVTAVRGNVDRGAWASRLPGTAVLEAGGARIYVLHDAAQLDLDPQAAGFAAVVSGHSHRPAIRERDGVLHFNPGSAGPRRFGLPITMGRLVVEGGTVRGEIVLLEP
jgi:hypothetical protein